MRLFGQRVDPDFDLAREQRRDHVKWVFFAGIGLWIIYLFSGLPLAIQVIQAYIATVLCYGANFYADRYKDLKELWLWKTIAATTLLHLLYLAVIFWLDIALPDFMPKVVVFIPVLAICFGIEAIIVDHIATYFQPAAGTDDALAKPE